MILFGLCTWFTIRIYSLWLICYYLFTSIKCFTPTFPFNIWLWHDFINKYNTHKVQCRLIIQKITQNIKYQLKQRWYSYNYSYCQSIWIEWPVIEGETLKLITATNSQPKLLSSSFLKTLRLITVTTSQQANCSPHHF